MSKMIYTFFESVANSVTDFTPKKAVTELDVKYLIINIINTIFYA